MKKLFAILMSIMMIACFMPTMAFAGTATDIVAGTDDKIGVSGSFTDGGMIASDSKTATFPSAEYQYQAAPATLTVTIKNTTNAEISNLQVVIDEATENFEAGTLGKTTLNAKADAAVDSTTFTVKPKQNLSTGVHTATVKIVNTDPSNGSPLATFTVSFTVTKKKVTVPTAKTNLVYTGASQTGVEVAEGSTNIYTLTGNTETNAKDNYSATATLTNPTNYEWIVEGGNTSENRTIPWKIAKKNPEAADFTFTAPENVTYDGQAKKATVALNKHYTGAGKVTVKYYKEDKEVQAADVKDAGTYTVKIAVAEGDNFKATTTDLTADAWTFTIEDKRGATANVANKVISGETKVTLNQSFTITLEGGLTFKDTVKENNDVSEWFAEGNLPKGLTAKITSVNDNKKSATITLSGIPAVKSNAEISITIPKDSLVGAAADMPVDMQTAKYAIKEFYMPTGGGGGGAAAKPTKPTTPEQKPATAAGKTAANAAITTAAAANKYDKAEQAEVDQIVKDAEAKIKEAKTEDEVKAIQKDAEAKLDKILTTEEKATIASLKEVSKRDFGTKSKKITKKNGKKAVNLSWAAPEGVDVDGYEIFRSTKKNSGYGTEPYFETPKTSYTNSKGLKSGKTYYYKVRAYVEINGERHYTDYSTNASRKI